MAGLLEHILHINPWIALLIVFAVPALEASVFLGFVFPGEIALLLGGVLAFEGRLPLWAVLVAGVAGAIIGDSAGYLVGRHYGHRLLDLGLFRRFLKPRHVARAEQYLAERGGKAVFFGRFTAALRVLIPGFAGMARMPYETFLPYNVAGGVIWGSAMVLLGYVAGASWQRVATYASQVGIALVILVVAAVVTGHLVRSARDPESWSGRRLAALATSAPVRWLERRHPRVLAWLHARFLLGPPSGFALTITVLAGVLAAWSFGQITHSVVHDVESARLDPKVLSFVLGHRSAWLSSVFRTVTWLGSGVVLWPVVVVAGALLWWRRRSLPLALVPLLVMAGAALLSVAVKHAVGRARPPSSNWLMAVHGFSYPSEHATQSLATWSVLALLVAAGRVPRVRTLLLAGAGLISLVVGISRIYLSVHWMTDVLGGWALGGTWAAVVVTGYLFAEAAGIVPPMAAVKRAAPPRTAPDPALR